MWWLVFSLVWWCGSSAIPSPGTEEWRCPEITDQPTVECTCDMPHTLRCTGDKSAIQIIGRTLRSLNITSAVSLLDCTLQNVTSLSEPLLKGVALHGLVISSGEIKEIHQMAFTRLVSPLQALGLPNNQLIFVPTKALSALSALDRLDLSGNKIKWLDEGCFKGLRNLSFIDLSKNVISKIYPNSFENLPNLRVLRLRGNRLTASVITGLSPLPTVEELDLSENFLVGPLGPKTFPRMESLKDLQLSHNSLSSIKMNALQGLLQLTSLRLQHNQVDVIEDHAFTYLISLVTLDLAHNRIVAVSGASLAHLDKLTDLDLRHNFLRAVTADLVLPLKSLQILKLDENDISIIAGDALMSDTKFKHFTLSDNPLNCDCTLNEFATWLKNTNLSKEDKSSAICTTPPSLENGLLIEVPLHNLVCGEEVHDPPPLAVPYKARINLKDFKYDGNIIKLQWTIDNEASPYTCDAIFVYEEEGPNEVLVESNPLKCNSSALPDPRILNVTLPSSIQLQHQHRYRYCVVLFESGQVDDVSLILGCSDVIPLIQNAKIQQNSDYSIKLPKVMSIHANLSYSGNLSIEINVYPPNKCELNLAILEENALLSQRKMNCTEPKYSFFGLTKGSYRVCANIIRTGKTIDYNNKPKCINVSKKEITTSFTILDCAFMLIFLILCFLLCALIWGVRKILRKPKMETHQCFLPPECEDQVQHNRYMKLQATTKL